MSLVLWTGNISYGLVKILNNNKSRNKVEVLIYDKCLYKENL